MFLATSCTIGLHSAVAASQRRLADAKPFCDFAIAKTCAVFTQIDCFNRILNRVYIGGVMARRAGVVSFVMMFGWLDLRTG